MWLHGTSTSVYPDLKILNPTTTFFRRLCIQHYIHTPIVTVVWGVNACTEETALSTRYVTKCKAAHYEIRVFFAYGWWLKFKILRLTEFNYVRSHAVDLSSAGTLDLDGNGILVKTRRISIYPFKSHKGNRRIERRQWHSHKVFLEVTLNKPFKMGLTKCEFMGQLRPFVLI